MGLRLTKIGINKRQQLCLFIVLLAALMIGFASNKPVLSIDYQNSYLYDYYFDDDHVYIPCTLRICNTADEPQCFTIVGYSEEDKSSGMLLHDELTCYDSISKDDMFYISPRSCSQYEVVFVGDVTERIPKADRELPDKIKIIPKK